MTSIRLTFKRKFLAGLVVSIPALVTVFLLAWIFRTIDGFLSPVYDGLFKRHMPGLGFISAIVLIFILGLISTNVFGQKVIRSIEKSLLNIPVFKSFYAPIKSIMDAFSNSSSFKKFVIVQYPRPGVYAFGFLTRENTIKTFNNGDTESLMAVYIPTNNLYLGEVALFSREDIFFTNIPVEDGIKIVLSGGIATPQQILEEKK
ncbi:MAG: DUF502 domain-containing protein [Nitrospiraceae bacterium]|nr:DUF502 domain-containing protein [Nitrospiraceae bacterium]